MKETKHINSMKKEQRQWEVRKINRDVFIDPETYCVRTCLNPPGHFKSSGVICFAGGMKYPKDEEPAPYYYVEISSCHSKVKLHAEPGAEGEYLREYVDKIKLLRDELDDYIEFLEQKVERSTPNIPPSIEDPGMSAEEKIRAEEILKNALGSKEGVINYIPNKY